LIEDGCVFGLALGIPQLAANFGELLDPGFASGMVSCLEGSGCDEPAKGYIERNQEHFVPLSANGANILYIQGLADAQATPERAACYLEAMAGMGVTPALCTDADATHFDVVERGLPFARQWVGALLSGVTLPSCDGGGLPACQ